MLHLLTWAEVDASLLHLCEVKIWNIFLIDTI